MTKEEAEKELAKILESPQGMWFCPLIKEKCDTSCVCFVAAYIDVGDLFSDAGYYMQQAYCGNAMFSETTIQY